jgi:hypothetical protein
MELLINYDDHVRWLSDRIDENPKSAIITSFGLYAGISYAGHDMTQIDWKFRSKTRDLMEKMRSVPDVKFLIGVPKYKSCKGRRACVDCEAEYCKIFIRLSNHVDHFPEFKWKMATDIHMKACIFIYGNECKGISGGRNFTDSSWFDCTFELSDRNIKTILKHIKPIWNGSAPVNDQGINSLLQIEGISEKGINSLIGESITPSKEEAPF